MWTAARLICGVYNVRSPASEIHQFSPQYAHLDQASFHTQLDCDIYLAAIQLANMSHAATAPKDAPALFDFIVVGGKNSPVEKLQPITHITIFRRNCWMLRRWPLG
jgi:hypothetical protein